MKSIFCFFQLTINVSSQKDINSLNKVDSNSFDSSIWSFIKTYKDTFDINDPINLLNIGYYDVYMGNNQRGNTIMSLGLKYMNNPNADIYHMLSVQNTKNGNYSLAIKHLEYACKLDEKIYGYYGWTSLYYYRDYEKSIMQLKLFDSLTPNFVDFPMGENIYFLIGLAYLQLNKVNDAIVYFESYIDNEKKEKMLDFIDNSVYYYLGICYEKLSKIKKANLEYKRALKNNLFFLEVKFRKALLIKNKRKKKKQLNEVDVLIQQGYSKIDSYVEIFQPVYHQMVINEINKIK